MKTTFIYALIEVHTKTLLYVGKSDNPEGRFGHHKRIYRRYHGCEIEFIVIDKVDYELEDEWHQAEIYWISLFREDHGVWLVNKLKGGNAFPSDASSLGGRMTKGMRKPKASEKYLPYRENMSAKMSGRISPMKGKSHSDETKRSIGSSNSLSFKNGTRKKPVRKPHSQETIEKMKLAALNRKKE